MTDTVYPYTKSAVGAKMFTVEWDMPIDNDEVKGDVFEAADCELLSISAYTRTDSGSPILTKLYQSNHNSAWDEGGVTTPAEISSPHNFQKPPAINEALPLVSTRYVFPRAEGIGRVGNALVTLLFREL